MFFPRVASLDFEHKTVRPLARMSMCRRLLTVTAGVGLPLAVIAAGTPATPWDDAALGLFAEAHTSFAEAKNTDRATRFGEAVTLINLQPKTDSNLDRAASVFDGLIAENPADTFGVGARYYLARIAQFHRTTPDTAEALRHYRELAALDSPHPFAQRAVVQLAMLELFEPGIERDEVAARFERCAKLGDTLSDAAARRDFNLVMGDAALRFALGDALALDHLLAADRAGIARATTQRDLWIRIAELGRRAGRDDVAIAYYQRFLENFLRDSRRRMVLERLEPLLAARAKEGAR